MALGQDWGDRSWNASVKYSKELWRTNETIHCLVDKDFVNLDFKPRKTTVLRQVVEDTSSGFDVLLPACEMFSLKIFYLNFFFSSFLFPLVMVCVCASKVPRSGATPGLVSVCVCVRERMWLHSSGADKPWYRSQHWSAAGCEIQFLSCSSTKRKVWNQSTEEECKLWGQSKLGLYLSRISSWAFCSNFTLLVAINVHLLDCEYFKI